MQLRLVALALALATAEGFTPGLARPQPSLARATSAATRVSLVASADAAPAGATRKELLAEAVRGPRSHSARLPRFPAEACVLWDPAPPSASPQAPPLPRSRRPMALRHQIGTGLITLLGTGTVASAVYTGAHQGIWQIAATWGGAVALAAYTTAGVSVRVRSRG